LGKTPDDDIDYGLGDHPIVKNEEVEEGDGWWDVPASKATSDLQEDDGRGPE
jgi:hypothetical protein